MYQSNGSSGVDHLDHRRVERGRGREMLVEEKEREREREREREKERKRRMAMLGSGRSSGDINKLEGHGVETKKTELTVIFIL